MPELTEFPIPATETTLTPAQAAQLPSAVNQRHTHSNKSTLDKFGEDAGQPTFSGQVLANANQVSMLEATIAGVQAEATAKWVLLNNVDNRSRANENLIAALMARIEALEGSE